MDVVCSLPTMTLEALYSPECSGFFLDITVLAMLFSYVPI